MLPLCLLVIGLAATFTTRSADRSLLLTLPALAALSAFALPILGRSLSALVDWFTLLFFSGCALVIWVVWISMQIGIPAQPAANVRRLAPGFEHSFSVTTFLIAIAATLAWAWLVKWRAGRHRAAIWKSLVLPAGGASLCWLLLMTLWLPLLDYARSYAPLVQQAVKATQPGGCVATHGMTRGQIAAFRFHGNLGVQAVNSTDCSWLIVDKDALPTLGQVTDLSAWAPVQTIRHPADRSEDILVYRRTP
jgi:4-amino-4-deoxy-L-arabinose transferase-like glycosyltransferase